MLIDNQMTLADISPEYQAFVDKFKPKKTTDDCYTPPKIYEAILDWCIERYGFSREQVVRPFWPGGDYLRYDYPEDCVVVDNPPFSILTQICRDYLRAGIKYFLFSPCLTCFGGGLPQAHIITAHAITYENGARVDTAFVTNLEDCIARSAPDLAAIIKKTDEELRKETTRELPKYTYPDNVVTAAMLRYMASHGVEFTVTKGQFIRSLDHQDQAGKAIYGGGYLISEKAAAEKAAAEKAAAEKAAAQVWELSEREKAIIAALE